MVCVVFWGIQEHTLYSISFNTLLISVCWGLDFGYIDYQEDISAIFSKADKNNNGRLKADDFKEVINDICERYPQVEIHLKKKQFKNFLQLLKNSDVDDELDIEKFKLALSEVDLQMKSLPATAQVKKRDESDLCLEFHMLINGWKLSFLFSFRCVF